MRNLTKNAKDYFFYTISILILGISWLPYLLCTVYVLPCSDDFSVAVRNINYGGVNLKSVFRDVAYMYMNWQGTYSAEAFASFFDPLGRMGVKGNAIFLFIFSIFFILLLSFFFGVLFSISGKVSRSRKCLLISVCVAMCLNCRVLTEFLLWFVGTAAYALPVMFALGGISCLLISFYDVRRAKKLIIVGAFLGAVACGGVLQVSGYICFIYLICIIYSKTKKKNMKAYTGAFLVVFTASVINVAAPGNYVRKEVINRSISMFKAGEYAVLTVFQEISFLFSASYLPWMLLVLFVLCLFWLPVTSEKLFHPVIAGLIIVLSWIISTFPVCYGYGSVGLQPRGNNLLDIYIVIGLVFWIYCITNWLKKNKVVLEKNNILTILLLSVICIGYQQSIVPVSEMPSMICLEQFASGDLKEWHEEWKNIFKEIENSDETMVEIPIGEAAYNFESVVVKPYISQDYKASYNKQIAEFYGKEGIWAVILKNDKEM